ncbi:hypothetical protein DFJ73DRAFT_775711 [Zopfochytrium polystomum]|nr:hypothetical protein DFJ73DRAFT_775711 [Zopfochytrium polystomum]
MPDSGSSNNLDGDDALLIDWVASTVSPAKHAGVADYLTSIDRLSRHMFDNLVWVFDAPLDTDNMKAALALALARFPTFAARVTPEFDRLSFTGDLGVAVLSATATKPVDAFYPVGGVDAVKSSPVRQARTAGNVAAAIFAKVPANQFDLADGKPLVTLVLVDIPLSDAFAVGVSFSHMIADAGSMAAFMAEWAKWSRFLATTPAEQVSPPLGLFPHVNDVFKEYAADTPADPVAFAIMDASFFAKPSAPEDEPGSAATWSAGASPVSVEVFTFTNLQLSTLKARIHQTLKDLGSLPSGDGDDPSPPPSTDDCLTALVFSVFGRLPTRDATARRRLHRPMNLRARLRLRPDVPGNLILNTVTAATPGVDDVAQLAAQLRRVLRETPVDTELRYLLDHLRDDLFYGSDVTTDMVLSSWRAFDFEQGVAFARAGRGGGLGAEGVMVPTTFFNMEAVGGAPCIGQLVAAGDGGIRLQMSLLREEMDHFREAILKHMKELDA